MNQLLELITKQNPQLSDKYIYGQIYDKYIYGQIYK